LSRPIDYLRKAGLKSADKKADRATAEGRVVAVTSERPARRTCCASPARRTSCEGPRTSGAFVEDRAPRVRARPDGVEDGAPAARAAHARRGRPIPRPCRRRSARFGENIQLTHFARSRTPGRSGTYVHHDSKQGAHGSVTTAPRRQGGRGAQGLCQHIVVYRPSRDSRRRSARGQSSASGHRPRGSDMKRSPGRSARRSSPAAGEVLRRSVLAEQPWILDDKLTVQKALEKALGAPSHRGLRAHSRSAASRPALGNAPAVPCPMSTAHPPQALRRGPRHPDRATASIPTR
jgi:elongation factor Ts